MAKVGARIAVTLRCSECKQRNYNTKKNKKNTPDRLELKSIVLSVELTPFTMKLSNAMMRYNWKERCYESV